MKGERNVSPHPVPDRPGRACLRRSEKAVQIAHQFNSRITMLNVYSEFMEKYEREMLRVSVEKMKERYRRIAIESKEEMKAVIHELHASDI